MKTLIFKKWRDEQIRQLQTDNLTERRLRMAIWQKTELTSWLNLLSAESKVSKNGVIGKLNKIY